VIISTLPEPETHPAWPEIERLLLKATAEGAQPFGEHHVLWAAIEDDIIWGVATTRLKADETETELLCVAGTRFREWIGLMEAEMCAWSRLCGARRFVSRGRHGWGRFARQMGWDALGLDDDGKALFFKEL
jgi:hypothetical protein